MRKFLQKMEQKERDLRLSFGQDITDPVERRKSARHVFWLDHGVLRKLWNNFAEVAPGVYRSNHPDHKRFARYKAMGIKTILNLRGVQKQPHYLFTEESCRLLGLDLVTVKFSARQAPHRERLLELFEVFETIEKPFLIHCKSGADRTGLVAALYLLVVEGAPLEVAMRQLSFRYLHIRRTATGILDHFFEVYALRNAKEPIGIVDWIKTEYDRDALTESFAAKQAGLKWWQGWR